MFRSIWKVAKIVGVAALKAKYKLGWYGAKAFVELLDVVSKDTPNKLDDKLVEILENVTSDKKKAKKLYNNVREAVNETKTGPLKDVRIVKKFLNKRSKR